MSWSFALINGKLAEIFFDKKKGVKFRGRAWVKKSEYKTKQEQEYIKKDTSKVRLSYKDGKYKRIMPS
jgi:hypothetical protein